MIEPQEGDAGRSVIYTDPHKRVSERGIITSWNDTHIFVRYGYGSTSAATPRDRLEWEFPHERTTAAVGGFPYPGRTVAEVDSGQ